MKTDRLEKLGLKSAANKVRELREKGRKMTMAYEHYRYVRQEKIDAFNEGLKKKTLERSGKKGHDLVLKYDALCFIPLEHYSEVPPADVLDKLEEAIERKCFDTFEIAKIESVVEQRDPIVFGRINGCPDRFFIAQWDDDVRIEDILKENEG